MYLQQCVEHGLHVCESQNVVAHLCQPLALQMLWAPHIIHQGKVHWQIECGSQSKLIAECHWVVTKHQGVEGHKQEHQSCDDGAEVCPCAVCVEDLVHQLELPVEEWAALAEENLHVALGPPGVAAAKQYLTVNSALLGLLML